MLMKPERLAKHYHTLSSWVGSGDETHVDLDHMEPFHLVVWKLHQAVELMHKFAKGFPFPQQNFDMCGLAIIQKYSLRHVPRSLTTSLLYPVAMCMCCRALWY